MANTNAAGQTHDQLQAACWLRAQQLYYPFMEQRLFCIPNDMHAGNVARWKQYEALGVTPGVWDMQLLWFNAVAYNGNSAGGYTITPAIHWFEFKVGTDKLSVTRIVKNKKIPGQKEFKETMEKIGHKFYIISEEQQFIDQMKLIIEPTLHIAKQIWKEELELGKKSK